jgi:hypothetical protein
MTIQSLSPRRAAMIFAAALALCGSGASVNDLADFKSPFDGSLMTFKPQP